MDGWIACWLLLGQCLYSLYLLNTLFFLLHCIKIPPFVTQEFVSWYEKRARRLLYGGRHREVRRDDSGTASTLMTVIRFC